MSLSVGEIRINLSAGTSQFVQDLEKANAKVHEFGGHVVSEHKAAAAAGKLLEGQMFNNTRAMDNFLVSTLKLGPVVSAMFPVLGAVAFGGVLVETGKKLYEFIKSAQEAPSKIETAFRGFNNSLKQTNDELALTNDKLKNDIAKLEGKPQNGLVVALDEARVAADKLAGSLAKDLVEMNKLLKENSIGRFGGLMALFTTGHTKASTTDFEKKIGGETGTGGYTGQVNTLTGDYQDKVDAAIKGGKSIKEVDAIREEARKAIKAKIDEIVKDITHDLDMSVLAKGASKGGQNYDSIIEKQSGALQGFKNLGRGSDLQFANVGLEEKKTQLTTAKENNAAFVEQLKQGYDLMMQTQDDGETMLASEKLAFRQNELAEISQYGAATKTLQKELALEIAKLQTDANKEGQEAFDQQMKRGQEMREQDLANQSEWAKRKVEIKDIVKKSDQNNPNFNALGQEIQDRTKLKPDELPGVVGDSARLQKAGYPTVNQQQSGIDQDKAALAAMQAMNSPLTQQLDLRKKILEAQIALGDAQGISTQQDQLALANVKAQQTLSQWNSIGAGTIGADFENQLMQLPQELGNTLANAVFNHRKGDSAGKQFGQMFKGLGKELFGDVAGKLIEKLAAEIAVHVLGIQIQSAQTTATVNLIAALVANTAALGVSGGASAAGGVASAAGGVAGGIGSGVSSLASGLVGPLISAAGGIIGGVISGFMSLHGDHEIVQAVQGTTAAVNALGTRLGGNGLTGTSQLSATGSTTGTSTGGFGSWVGNTIMSTLFGGGNAIPVSVVSISPIAMSAGLFRMFGFADGGRPTPGQAAWIGERGKELWVPDRPGTIIPNHQASDYLSSRNITAANSTSSSYTSGNHTFNIHGAVNPQAVVKAVADYMKNSSPKFSPYSS